MPAKRNFDDLNDDGSPVTSEDIAAGIANEDLSGQPQQTAITAYSDQPQFDRSEIVLPRLRIAQGLTSEVQDGSAKPGQILLSGFEPLDEAVVIPLKFARLRELRGEGEDRNTVLCVSNDARFGIGDPGGNCQECPMAEWSAVTKRGKEIRVPPKCTFIFSYMVYVTEHKQMAVVEFRKTSERVGRLLNTMVAQRGLRQFAVKLGAEIKRDGNRTFAVPTLSPATASIEDMAAARAFD